MHQEIILQNHQFQQHRKFLHINNRLRFCGSFGEMIILIHPDSLQLHLFLQLLFFFQQQETSSTFNSVFFFCKLTEKLLLKLAHLNTDKSFYIAKINSTYPLSTPRTRFNIKKEPTTISGIKKTQLNTVPRASFV